jgi:hypothetical protein
MNIGDIYFAFRGDSKQLVTDARKAGEQAGKVTGDALDKSLSGRLKSSLSDFKRQGGIGGALMGGVGLGAGLGAFNLVTQGIGKVVDGIGDAIDAASNLAESQSKVNVVFDEGADAILTWSETSAEAMGLSKQAALEAAGTFGNLFDSLGLASEATVDMSKGAVQLASDLASFNNVGTEETLLAIRSGLLGEAEPMRRFGSALSAARVEQFALAEGWVQNKKDLTETMKVQARYQLILQDTANAQGDFARTSGGLANKQRTADAKTQDLVASLGKMLAPLKDIGLDVGLAAVGAVESLGGAFNDLWRFMDPGQAKLEDTRSAIRKLAEDYDVNADAVIDMTLAIDANTRAVEDQQEAARRASDEAAFRHGQAHQAELDWRALNGVTDDAALSQDQAAKASAYVTEQMGYQRFVMNEAGDAWLTYEEFAQTAGGTQEVVNEQLEEGRKAILRYTDSQDAWSRSLIGSLYPITQVAEHIEEIPEATDEAVEAVKVDMTELATTISATTERVRNKRGKGWHWKTDISHQLKDLRHQFREDIKAMQWILDHPEAAGKQKTELERELGRAETALERAFSEGNLEGIRTGIALVDNLKGSLAALTARDYETNLTLAVWTAKHTKGLVKGVTRYTLNESRDDRPGLAAGGPVARGMPYTVGERGREMFVPATDGTIIPNSALRSGRIDFYVHDPDGGLARAGISTSGLASALASSADAQSRWEDAF